MDEPPSYTLLFIFPESGISYFILGVLFLVITAVISAVEAAFFSLDADDLERFRVSPDHREKTVADLQANPRLLLSTLTLSKYGMISACAILYIFYNFHAVKSFTFSGLVTGSVLLTLGITFLGVILPKIYGRANNLSIARWSSHFCRRAVQMSRLLLKPFLRMSFRVEMKLERLAEQHSMMELTHALKRVTADKNTTEREKEILEGIVNFGALAVREVMRHRGEISFADVSLDFHQLLDFVRRSGYSRIPACRSSLDKIEGVLYIKDLLPFLHEQANFQWQKLLRPAYFVPESKKVDLLLKDFQEKHVHLAIVVDEFGATSGLITLEDVIEEIIGDIHDEFDEIGSHYQRLDEETFIFDGKTPVDEFYKTLQAQHVSAPLPERSNTSLAGMLIDMNGGIPEVGEKIVLEPFIFIVEKIDHRRIKKIRVEIHETNNH